MKTLRGPLVLLILGLVVESATLSYGAPDSPAGLQVMIAGVVVAILLTAVGTAMALRSSTRTTGWFGALIAPLFLTMLVLTSIAGPVSLLRLTSSTSQPQEAMSKTDIRAEFVLLAARDEGIGPALTLLQREVEIDSALEHRSHHVAHMAGRLAIEASDFDLVVLKKCSLSFASGCFHGVLERYFYAHPNISDDSIPSFCRRITGETWLSARMLECSHGLGHGLAVRSNHSYRPAVESCDLLTSGVERSECYDGVFMETIASAMGGGHPDGNSHQATGGGDEHDRSAGASHQNVDCDAVGAPYRSSCWAYEYAAILARSGGSRDLTVAECRSAATPDAVASCMFGLGKQIAADSNGDDREVANYCAGLPPDEANVCISGAVEHLIDQDWRVRQGAGLCGATSGSLAERCYEQLGLRLAFLVPDETASNQCDEYVSGGSACRRGIAQGRKLQESGGGHTASS